MLALQSAFGFFALIGIAWLMSEDRRAVPWRIVVSGTLATLMTGAVVGTLV
ncbi:MAG: Na+ dependent nucleoside transporter N-terminal domain-containing protein [Burkholderiales bacterium]